MLEAQCSGMQGGFACSKCVRPHRNERRKKVTNEDAFSRPYQSMTVILRCESFGSRKIISRVVWGKVLTAPKIETSLVPCSVYQQKNCSDECLRCETSVCVCISSCDLPDDRGRTNNFKRRGCF